MKTLNFVHHSSFFTYKFNVSSEFPMVGIVNAVFCVSFIIINKIVPHVTHVTHVLFMFSTSQNVPTEALELTVNNPVPLGIMDVCVDLSVSVTSWNAITWRAVLRPMVLFQFCLLYRFLYFMQVFVMWCKKKFTVNAFQFFQSQIIKHMLSINNSNWLDNHMKSDKEQLLTYFFLWRKQFVHFK